MGPRGVPWPSRGVPWPLYEEYAAEDPYYIYCYLIIVSQNIDDAVVVSCEPRQ